MRRRAGRDGGAQYRRQRRGFGVDQLPRRAVLLHAASVGEVAAAIPLLERLVEAGETPLVLSTNTPTGRALAERSVPAGTAVCYLPIDRPAPVRRFLDALRPRLALIMETELWPWLYAGLAGAGTPIVLVNARLSRRSRGAPRWLRPALGFCARRCRRILARSGDDAEAFAALGAERTRIRTLGNLKYAPVSPHRAIDPGRPFVLAASTHDDEEPALARAWQGVERRDRLLVIAPRHPERGRVIAAALGGAGLQVARRSLGEAVDDRTDVYLADTLGELPALIAGAEAVFMGGSLVPHGGQNVLEPARAGRAIVTGPHMDNFREESARLEQAGALLRCPDAAAAVAALARLVAEPGAARRMGDAGRAALAGEADIVERYFAALADLLAEVRRAQS